MMEQNNELVCSQNHSQPVCSVIVEKRVKKEKRLLCNECMINFDQNIKIRGINVIREMIEMKLQKNNEKKQQFLSSKKQLVEQLTGELNELKSNLIITFDQILGDLNNWKYQLAKEQQINNAYKFIDELEKLLKPGYHEKEFLQQIDDVIYWNNDAIEKILKKIRKLRDVFSEASSKMKNCFQQIIKIPQTDVQLTLISNDTKKKECCVIAFNEAGSIMVSGCGKDIILWNFNDGKLKEIQKLQFHKSTVSCIIFSKISDNFVSGSYDGTIRIWKQFKGQEWKSLQPYKDSNRIFCLILSQNESVLISGSEDHAINVWDIDFERNRLNLSYSLIKHTELVYSLSLNETETYLVSCGSDQQIIVWARTTNNQWEFKQIITQSIKEVGTKISFITENQFIWICGDQNGQDCICFFELQNEEFQEQFNQQIKLISNNKVFDFNLFPVKFNKENKIILLRHKFNIYIISPQFHNKYKISQKLQFLNNSIYGSMTNDAKFIVLWEQSSSSFYIYKMKQNSHEQLQSN